eukprot:scaffold8850_cov72-Phaeocystis_antarctica.AAC.2
MGPFRLPRVVRAAWGHLREVRALVRHARFVHLLDECMCRRRVGRVGARQREAAVRAHERAVGRRARVRATRRQAFQQRGAARGLCLLRAAQRQLGCRVGRWRRRALPHDAGGRVVDVEGLLERAGLEAAAQQRERHVGRHLAARVLHRDEDRVRHRREARRDAARAQERAADLGAGLHVGVDGGEEDAEAVVEPAAREAAQHQLGHRLELGRHALLGHVIPHAQRLLAHGRVAAARVQHRIEVEAGAAHLACPCAAFPVLVGCPRRVVVAVPGGEGGQRSERASVGVDRSGRLHLGEDAHRVLHVACRERGLQSRECRHRLGACGYRVGSALRGRAPLAGRQRAEHLQRRLFKHSRA